MTVYSKKYHIDLSDVDFMKKLKLSTLFIYFQDIASLAAEELGLGIETLEKEHGLAWVLMKIRVDIIRNPSLDEEITMETWPQKPKKLEFERDYLVRDKQGKTIIRAVSSWVIMDLKERKLKRSSAAPIQYSSVKEERAIDCKLGKIKGFNQLDAVYNKVIGYSDVDFNGHLNNSRYVDYMMDCFSMEEHRNNEVKSVEVHFSNEVLPGETILLQKDTSTNELKEVFLIGTNKKDSKTVFKAKVKIDVRKE